MSDLFWPGDERAGELLSDVAFLHALLRVETGWLGVLVDAGIAPRSARAELTDLVGIDDLAVIAGEAERDGNPVTGLVAMLRQRTVGDQSRWLHRGLTSQDVVDTALVLCVGDTLNQLDADLGEAVTTLVDLIGTHRHAPMAARTLTQQALPMTVGAKLAAWLAGLLDAAEPLAALRSALPVQAGGAAGTLAATTELSGSPAAAQQLGADLAARLGVAAAEPWHTRRAPITRIGDALVSCCDACGHIAADVATLSRPEIGELSEGSAGGSSTMPHKRNPVLSVLIRRAALSAAPLGATLHTAAALNVDERADGAWHSEWATLRTLGRRTVVAVSQTGELLAGLRIDSDRASANLNAAEGITSEQQMMAELVNRDPRPAYLGATDIIIDAALRRACAYRTGTS